MTIIDEESMNVENAVIPSPDQIKALGEDGPGGPIYMVNLLKFKPKAEYADDRATELSGQEAYGIYATEVAGHLAKVGGKPVLGGQVTGLTLGVVEELWDAVGIAMYPDRKAMLTMIMDPAYLKSAEHRAAGLAGQLNIEMVMPGS
jgi:uncharacterized protein (DUF1330 family)